MLVEVAGDEGLYLVPVPGGQPQEGRPPRGVAPLVQVAGVKVGVEILNVEIELARCVGPVDQEEDAKLLQLP